MPFMLSLIIVSCLMVIIIALLSKIKKLQNFSSFIAFSMEDEVRKMLKKGLPTTEIMRKINNETGLGLWPAKEYVDSIKKRMQ